MINTPKVAVKWSGFKSRNNHAGHIFGVAELSDAAGITIPGLTLQLEIRAPVEVDRCYFLFSLMQRTAAGRERTYQLEVVPPNKRSHNGRSPIYGPHEHIGPIEEPVAVASLDVSCDNWNNTLLWFFNRVSVTPFAIENPHDYVEL